MPPPPQRYFAHSPPSEFPDRWEELRDHLQAVADRAAEFAAPFGAEAEARFASLEGLSSLDAPRGVEGNAARTYFEVFDLLIAQQKEAFFFGSARAARPSTSWRSSALPSRTGWRSLW